jgi:hypothetical protein
MEEEPMATQAIPEFLQSIDDALTVSTPLINASSADQLDCIYSICERLVAAASAGKKPAPVLLLWDIVNGLQPILKKEDGPATYDYLLKNWPMKDDPKRIDFAKIAAVSAKPTDALKLAVNMPPRTRLFMLNAHRFYEDPFCAQAIGNLRDLFKQNGRALFPMSPTPLRQPPQLLHDVLSVEEPFPDRDARTRILADMLRTFNQEQTKVGQPAITLDPRASDRAIDISSGLSAFALEQSIAMNITTKGINILGLRKRKRQYIENSPGMTIWQGKERFEDLKGQDNAQRFGMDLLNGRDAPKAVIIIDEGDKNAGDDGGDTSGTNQEMQGTLLSAMADYDWPAMILLGPGGGGKSAYAKALGNMNPGGELDTLMINPAAMKSKFVGSSVENLIANIRTIRAISDDRPVIVFTANKFNFSPEMQRRCYLGKWFFDLPSADERAAIWTVWCKKYDVTDTKFPEDEGWTGAEIRACVLLAWRFQKPLIECARKIVPIAKTAEAQIEELRNASSGRFTSSSYDGIYTYSKVNVAVTELMGRKGRRFDNQN